jgi:hypothetical protein
MNKKLIFGSACLGLVLVLSACGTQSVNNAAPTDAASGRPDRRPDFGQPKNQPEVRGVVKSVVGNEVVVLKIDQPQRGTSTPTGTDASTSTRKALSLGGSGSGAGGRGMGGYSGGRPGGEISTTDRATMLEKIKAMSTGEEKVIIPVGIKMLKSSSDATNRTMVEANISDITADKMITIWLDASVTDKKVASFVLIN